MPATLNLHNCNDNLSSEREEVIQRIMNLSDEQFKLLITLYSQQEKESVSACQTLHQSSA